MYIHTPSFPYTCYCPKVFKICLEIKVLENKVNNLSLSLYIFNIYIYTFGPGVHEDYTMLEQAMWEFFCQACRYTLRHILL